MSITAKIGFSFEHVCKLWLFLLGTHSRFSRVLEYKKSRAMARKSIPRAPLGLEEKVRNTLQIPGCESPLLRSYVYRYENNEILRTLCFSRFLEMCNLRKNPQIGPKGTPKIDPVLDPLYFKSLHTCTGFKAISGIP